MGKLRKNSAVIAATLGLAISCGLSSPAFAVLSSGLYVSTADPALGPDSDTGDDVWTIAPLPLSTGASSGHDSSTANLSLTDDTPAGALPSGGIDDADGASWRITSDGLSLIAATATFADPLDAGDFISIDFDPGAISAGDSGRVEVRFKDAGGLTRAALVALGGGSEFLFVDGTGIGISFTGIPLSDDGFNLRLVDMGLGSFTLTVKDLESSMTTSLPGVYAGGVPSLTIDEIQIFNQAAGVHATNSVYFNNLVRGTISSTAVPEVSSIIAIPFALCFAGAASVLRRRQQCPC